MEQLNLNLLKSLYALLSCANVSRAAEQLHLTQSAMSRNLALLRDQLGDPLLIREGTHYLLTNRAKALLPRLQKILGDINQLLSEQEFSPADCTRSFVIASSDYVAQYIFPEIVEKVRQAAPNIQLQYRMMEPEFLQNLGTLPLDLVTTLISEPPDNLHGKHIGQDYPVCVMAASHPLAKTNLTFSHLIQYPHLKVTGGGDKDSFLDRYLFEKGEKRQIAVTTPFFSSAFSVLPGSEMMLTIPRHIAVQAQQHFPLIYKPLPMDVPTEQYYLLWHDIHHNDPVHRWLREVVYTVLTRSEYSISIAQKEPLF